MKTPPAQPKPATVQGGTVDHVDAPALAQGLFRFQRAMQAEIAERKASELAAKSTAAKKAA